MLDQYTDRKRGQSFNQVTCLAMHLELQLNQIKINYYLSPSLKTHSNTMIFICMQKCFFPAGNE